MKLYKLCDSRGYNMAAYLSKHVNADENVIPAYGTVLKLIRQEEGSRKMNSCSTIPQQKGHARKPWAKDAVVEERGPSM
jgi:hypothetical protein